ncbi:putative La-related protein 1 [Hypsibius exemplaris]|uniref:La-related protein 1 n=1 Tax=Hypsibius exemplaris TaxID=2072580 RepID=A0A1W0WZU1_HYPEX|nr:putative La-related protein 1 [Hypsibius exemplaris]
MATSNGPLFATDVVRPRNQQDFTSTLRDLRQWPTLGQCTEPDQKKKTTAPNGNSASNSTGKSASSSRIKTGGVVTTSRSSSSQQPKASTLSVSSDTPSTSTSSSQIQTSDPPGGEQHAAPASKKKGKKKKNWETKTTEYFAPMPSRAAIMEDLRVRRDEWLNSPEYQAKQAARQAAAASTPRGSSFPDATAPPTGASNNNNPTTAASRTKTNNAGPSTSANGPQTNNQPLRNNSSGGSGSNPFDYNRRSVMKKSNPPPAAFNTLNRPRIARKMPAAFRARDMAYDEDYNGDGCLDVTDDNGSQYDYDGGRSSAHNESGFGGDWSSYTDWSNSASSSLYYDYGVDSLSAAAQGYQGDEYSNGYGYGYSSNNNGTTNVVDSSQGGLDETGLYIPPSPMPIYTPSPAELVDLKEMIKYQIEYYFSAANLQKDFFLRRMMAPDGSVMLGLVASFQRVRNLTQDFNLILESIVNSDVVEITDNFMIRPRETPDFWPIPEEEEEQSNAGYYYVHGEEDYTGFGVLSSSSGGGHFDETDESGTGEDASSYPDDDLMDEADDEEEEGVSMDGSDLSELSAEDMRKMLPGHHHAVEHASMSEKFLQQVM